jgi:REP element-mobilizing transposase RayT
MNSHRRLPHSYPEGRWLFLTWTLHGSLPAGKLPPPAKATSGEAFAWIDRYLDNTRTGPQFLRQASIAQAVVDSLYTGVNLGHYELGPFVIMANHVHVLLRPLVAPPQLLKALKGSTAREANRLLNRTGEQFWQRESYDHWVRDQAEWNRIASYIEKNPVRAGLVSRIEEYPWSSANPRIGVHTSVNAARRSACATSGEAWATVGEDQARTSACATSGAKLAIGSHGFEAKIRHSSLF